MAGQMYVQVGFEFSGAVPGDVLVLGATCEDETCDPSGLEAFHVEAYDPAAFSDCVVAQSVLENVHVCLREHRIGRSVEGGAVVPASGAILQLEYRFRPSRQTTRVIFLPEGNAYVAISTRYNFATHFADWDYITQVVTETFNRLPNAPTAELIEVVAVRRVGVEAPASLSYRLCVDLAFGGPHGTRLPEVPGFSRPGLDFEATITLRGAHRRRAWKQKISAHGTITERCQVFSHQFLDVPMEVLLQDVWVQVEFTDGKIVGGKQLGPGRRAVFQNIK